MCVWSDSTWLEKGPLVLGSQFDKARVQPNSYELSLGNSMWKFKKSLPSSVELTESNMAQFMVHQTTNKSFLLHPGQCALVSVNEYIEVPKNTNMQVTGKSSIGRKFVIVHTTAGFVDSGYKGKLTLELVNLSPLNIRLRVGCRIAQLVAYDVNNHVIRPYGHPELGSHYQGDLTAQPSKS